MSAPFSETQLYEPVKKLFTGLGFSVNGEVKGCDMTAVKDEQLIIIELKKDISMKLLYQIIDRQKVTDEVYAAIPRPKGKKDGAWTERAAVLKRLSAGLITVSLDSPIPLAEIVFYPQDPRIYTNKRKQSLIQKEIRLRSADFNTGGTSKTKLVTAYREKAIKLACLLQHATVSLADLRILMDDPKIHYMLRTNQYGWYERCGRALYQLSAEGQHFFAHIPPEFLTVTNFYREHYRNLLDKKEGE